MARLKRPTDSQAVDDTSDKAPLASPPQHKRSSDSAPDCNGDGDCNRNDNVDLTESPDESLSCNKKTSAPDDDNERSIDLQDPNSADKGEGGNTDPGNLDSAIMDTKRGLFLCDHFAMSKNPALAELYKGLGLKMDSQVTNDHLCVIIAYSKWYKDYSSLLTQIHTPAIVYTCIYDSLDNKLRMLLNDVLSKHYIASKFDSRRWLQSAMDEARRLRNRSAQSAMTEANTKLSVYEK